MRGSWGVGITALATVLLQIGHGTGQMYFPENRFRFDQVGFVESAGETYSSENTDPGVNSFVNSIPLDSTFKENSISRGLNNFALNLNKLLLNKNGGKSNENIALSPLSIAGALSLLLLGSVGRTYDEIAVVLGYFNGISTSRNTHREFGDLLDKITGKGDYVNSRPSNFPQVAYGSALFLQNDCPIRQQYEEFIRSVYKSLVMQVDFRSNGAEAQRNINKWVSDITNGKIREMISSPPPAQTRLIIGSALYFKGEWEKYFLDGLTNRSPFTLDKRYPEQTITVDMMGNEGVFPFYKSQEHGCMLVGLPYKGNNTVLYAIKPLDATKKDLKHIINELNADTLDTLIRNSKRQATIVTFPKMKVTGNYNLKLILEEMGIQSVFSSSASNLALLSPSTAPGVTPITLAQDKYVERSGDNDGQFIFSRIGAETPEDDNCFEVFQSQNSTASNCTTTEIIGDKTIRVTYKRLGDKIGRKVVKRSLNDDSQTELNNYKYARVRRETSGDLWNPGLYVDEVVHKVDIDITETGTEAAAATAVYITKDGRRPVFTANEPFFFVIRDEETKFILYSAAVYRPVPNYS